MLLGVWGASLVAVVEANGNSLTTGERGRWEVCCEGLRADSQVAVPGRDGGRSSLFFGYQGYATLSSRQFTCESFAAFLPTPTSNDEAVGDKLRQGQIIGQQAKACGGHATWMWCSTFCQSVSRKKRVGCRLAAGREVVEQDLFVSAVEQLPMICAAHPELNLLLTHRASIFLEKCKGKRRRKRSRACCLKLSSRSGGTQHGFGM